MIQKTETLLADSKETSRNILIAIAAFDSLGWTVKYATNVTIVAYTPRSWNKWDYEITVEIAENEVSITSRLVHNEGFDLMGKNKKHLRDFKLAFEETAANMTDDKLGELRHKLEILKEETVKKTELEIEKATKLDEVMNISGGNKYLTYAIMGINILMFVITIISGVNAFAPQAFELIPFGANYAPLTSSGEWWRLFTSTVLHFGFIHLALNMYALYVVGVHLEPMIGKTKYLTAYVCTGIIASLASFIWHQDDPVVSAGASGAVFGMYGVFVALLTTNLIPKEARGQLLQSIGIFVAYNVFYGLKPNSGIDNAAHIGGLVSGLVIGYVYYFTIRNRERKSNNAVTGFIALATIILVFVAMRDAKPNDDFSFQLKMEEFSKAEEKALAPYASEDLTADQIRTIMIPEWQKAQTVFKETEGFKLTERNQKLQGVLKEYVDLRVEESKLRLKAIEENTGEYNSQINEIVRKIEDLLADLKSQDK